MFDIKFIIGIEAPGATHEALATYLSGWFLAGRLRPQMTDNRAELQMLPHVKDQRSLPIHLLNFGFPQLECWQDGHAANLGPCLYGLDLSEGVGK